MRWQIGGNIRPVRLVCELNWKECPYAILNYMWSEIVTDVVDCVTNESILLRIIILLLVSTILVHTIWSRLKSLHEGILTKETLNDVGYKLQDLELRVNILTYKMQYGTWPLPEQIKGTSIEGHKKNIRLTLSDNRWFNKCLKNPRNDNYNYNTRVRKPKSADKRFNYRHGHNDTDKLYRRKSDKSIVIAVQDQNDLTSNLKRIDKSDNKSNNNSSTSINSEGKSSKNFDTSIYSETILKSSQKQITTKESLADVQNRLEKLQTVLKNYSQDDLLVVESSDGNKREEFREFLKELSDLRSDTESDDSKVDFYKDKLIITESIEENKIIENGNKIDLNSNSKEDLVVFDDAKELKQAVINEFYLENNCELEEFNYIKPKLLDIINEEQSGSSCTEKISKSMLGFKKISEESEISLDSVSSKDLSRDESLEIIQMQFNQLIDLEKDDKDLRKEELNLGDNCESTLSGTSSFDQFDFDQSSESMDKNNVHLLDNKFDGLDNKFLEETGVNEDDKKILLTEVNRSEEDLINLNDEVEVKVQVDNDEKIDSFIKLNLMDEDKLDDVNLSDEPLTARTVINETSRRENKNLIELEQMTFEALAQVENSWDAGITKAISETSIINLDSMDEELKLSEIKSLNVLSKESSIYLTVDSISDLSVDKSRESGSREKINLLENFELGCEKDDSVVNKSNESTGLLSGDTFEQSLCDCDSNLSDSKSNTSNLSDKKSDSNPRQLTGMKLIKKDNKILNKNTGYLQKGVTRSNSSLTSDNDRDKGERRIINLQRRSKSYVTPRKVEASPRITGTGSKFAYNSRSRESMNKLSKSCIPVLKTRLERKDEYRPKSPARGPLTVSVSLENSNQNIPVITEGSFRDPVMKRNYENKNKNNEFIMKDQTIIYVNVVADNDNCVTKVIDPKTFLEFIKDRELSVQEVIDKHINSSEEVNEKVKKDSKIITVVSSAINNNISSSNVNNSSNKNNNSNNNIESNKVKEKEVLAKPSTTHTSTSISDLSAVSKLKLPNNDHKHIYERSSNSSIENILKRKKNFTK